MDRRTFLQTAGSMSATLGAEISPQNADGENGNSGQAGQQGKLILSNSDLMWQFEWSEGRLKSSLMENRLTGRKFPFSDAQEVVLTFASSKRRIEIPWWSFVFGPDKTPVSPALEQGLTRGYHLPSFSDQGWGATENLLLRSLRGGGSPPGKITYAGYGWFRHWFELPQDAGNEEIVFVLGGYDFQDWNEYWVYLNGTEIGHRLSSGRWRAPGEFLLSPSSPHYASLRFGPREKNLLAVRTRKYDKHFGGLTDEVLKHYIFEPVLVDQIISVGKPYLRISDFEIRSVEPKTARAATFQLRSLHHPIQVAAHFELDGPTRRKWLDINNPSAKEMLLLDVQLDDFVLNAPTSEGGLGEPVFAGQEVFCTIEHPAGINQGADGRVKMVHFPAARLAPGASTRSHVSLVSVAQSGQALDHFTDYIQEKSPRKKKAIAIYDPFGINNQWGGCPTQCDVEMLNGLQLLQKWRQQGFSFDYYVPDWGWVDQASDLTRFAPQCFPEGPEKVVEGVREAGMKFGLWFSVSGGNESCGEYAPAWPSAIPAPGTSSESAPPLMVYRNGYPVGAGAPITFCVASEPYFSILKNAIRHHMRANSLKFFKLDSGNYYCNSTQHEHLPGKYSVEAMYNRLLDIADSAREVDPEIYVMWYWGVRSPFFALHGDSIFESGLFMEGSGTSWFPSLYYRDSVTLNLDQGTAFAKTIPPINKDSLGVWLADNRWGNFMGNERWKEALIMDLGRGNLLFPQLWGDIYLLSGEDVAFLMEMVSLVKKNQSLLLKRTGVFGDTWKNEVYGYAYFQGSHGFVFANNVHFASRKAELTLGPGMGLEAQTGQPVEIISHFPDRNRLLGEDGSEFKVGGRMELCLRPFEVMMLEVTPGKNTALPAPARRLSLPQIANLGLQLNLQPVSVSSSMVVQLADAERFKKEGKIKKTSAFECTLPSLAGDPPTLAIPVWLRRANAEWRYSPVVVEIVQVVAWLDGRRLQLIPVPDARQYGDTQKAGCSWVLYKIRLNPEWSHKKLQFAVHAYLPGDVEPQIEAWVVKQWWEISTRPLGDGYYGDEPS